MNKSHHVFSDIEIITAIEESFCAAWIAFGALQGAEIQVTEEVLLLITDRSDENLNVILRMKFAADVAESKIQIYLDYLSSKGVPFSWGQYRTIYSAFASE